MLDSILIQSWCSAILMWNQSVTLSMSFSVLGAMVHLCIVIIPFTHQCATMAIEYSRC